MNCKSIAWQITYPHLPMYSLVRGHDSCFWQADPHGCAFGSIHLCVHARNKLICTNKNEITGLTVHSILLSFFSFSISNSPFYKFSSLYSLIPQASAVEISCVEMQKQIFHKKILVTDILHS